MSIKQIPKIGTDIDVSQFRDDTIARIFGVIVGLIVWTILAYNFPFRMMPTPLETASLMWEILAEGNAWTHIWATGIRIFFGFLGALILGAIIGICLGISDYGQQFFTPYVLLGLSIPGVAWAAVMTLIWGLNIYAPVSAAILVVYPYIAINIWKGVENINVDLVEMSNSFHISRMRIFKRVIIPNMAPDIFTALRYSLAISWKVVTVAEIFASSSGIGYKLINAYQFYNFPELWAWVGVFMILIIIIEYGIFQTLERRMYKYRPDADFSIV